MLQPRQGAQTVGEIHVAQAFYFEAAQQSVQGLFRGYVSWLVSLRKLNLARVKYGCISDISPIV